MFTFTHARRSATLAGFAIVTAFVLIALFLGNGNEPQASRAVAPSFHATGPHYASLVELIQASDLIVTGTVQEVRAGETEAIGTREEIHHTEAVVAIERVLKGQAPPDGRVTVETLKGAFAGPNAVEWRAQGADVLLFLSPSREGEPHHILANTNYSETAYLIQPGESLVDTLSGYPGAASPKSLTDVVRGLSAAR